MEIVNGFRFSPSHRERLRKIGHGKKGTSFLLNSEILAKLEELTDINGTYLGPWNSIQNSKKIIDNQKKRIKKAAIELRDAINTSSVDLKPWVCKLFYGKVCPELEQQLIEGLNELTFISGMEVPSVNKSLMSKVFADGVYACLIEGIEQGQITKIPPPAITNDINSNVDGFFVRLLTELADILNELLPSNMRFPPESDAWQKIALDAIQHKHSLN